MKAGDHQQNRRSRRRTATTTGERGSNGGGSVSGLCNVQQAHQWFRVRFWMVSSRVTGLISGAWVRFEFVSDPISVRVHVISSQFRYIYIFFFSSFSINLTTTLDLLQLTMAYYN
ncbi:hypothetical protein HanXRQr2_Chr10g0432761 [Helianthus annuus]|uniref:Uncharacterized protein n=1 Tax=Helianthus annuus TaxID=4232 RepID=A0A9K3N3K4_HELAN|nr:hypothetical protein HanXRQr2_Chr10g0432761 [Helianthus annuus]